MIGRLAGRVDVVADDRVILDVGGVGYHLGCSARTISALGGSGSEARVLVETFIRDDRIVLYGFFDEAEQTGFRILTSVQGVGPRVALAILSVLDPGELADAVRAEDRSAFVRASGVGPRLARRIVTELKDKVEDMGPGTATGPGAGAGSVEEDAIAALVNLGYTRSEAWRAVSSVREGMVDETEIGVLIRASLKELAR